MRCIEREKTSKSYVSGPTFNLSMWHLIFYIVMYLPTHRRQSFIRIWQSFKRLRKYHVVYGSLTLFTMVIKTDHTLSSGNKGKHSISYVVPSLSIIRSILPCVLHVPPILSLLTWHLRIGWWTAATGSTKLPITHIAKIHNFLGTFCPPQEL